MCLHYSENENEGRTAKETTGDTEETRESDGGRETIRGTIGDTGIGEKRSTTRKDIGTRG